MARRFFAPEVVQTSVMDCGPSVLSSVLEGFGVRASYGRLREACQTEVDGTSIDTLEEILVDLGLDAEQQLLPVDQLLMDESKALPAILVVRLPSGQLHFVVVWRRHGSLFQVMDPASGRRWRSREEILRELHVHTMPVPAAAWRAWAETDARLLPLRKRLTELGASDDQTAAWIGAARSDAGVQGFATLDAAARMAEAVVSSGGLYRGAEAVRLLDGLLRRVSAGAPSDTIPPSFWSVRPTVDDEQRVHLRGAVLVRIKGPARAGQRSDASRHLSPELVAALRETATPPLRLIASVIRRESALAPFALLAVAIVAALTTLIEALILRGVVDLTHELTVRWQRLAAVVAMLGFVAATVLLEASIAESVQRLGRGLETRLRVGFLEKVPRLGLRYFRSRPAADMTHRGHGIEAMRMMPDLVMEALRAALGLLATTLGILWLDPRGFVPALLLSMAVVSFPLMRLGVVTERELRVRTHAGAMLNSYLDAQLGMVPLRAHGAARALRREHESVLVHWARAARELLRASVWADAAGALATAGFAAWLFLDYLGQGADRRGMLLVVYWALGLGVLGRRFAAAAMRFAAFRNITARVAEPLDGASDAASPTAPHAGRDQVHEAARKTAAPRGVSIQMQGVTVHAGGHRILESLSLVIEGGTHVAIVGASGAGKSSLIGLLLGWHRPSTGSVTIDGAPLDTAALDRLRRRTAWVDPDVRLWNRSLLDNLTYASSSPFANVGAALERADLQAVLQRLPEGLQTGLGEGGGLVSGGEGQRVRFGRALLREDVGLALLDEPFRGLDVARSRDLLARARRFWQGQTLLCATHDVNETLSFPRVLVIDAGRVVEDGAPSALAARPDSRYAALLRAERAAHAGLWRERFWRRVSMKRGVVTTTTDDGERR